MLKSIFKSARYGAFLGGIAATGFIGLPAGFEAAYASWHDDRLLADKQRESESRLLRDGFRDAAFSSYADYSIEDSLKYKAVTRDGMKAEVELTCKPYRDCDISRVTLFNP